MSFRPRFARVVRLAALLAAGAAFSLAPAFGAPGTTAAGEATPPPATGEHLVTMPAPDLDGKTVDVGAVLKGKPALVTFWASWCQPCMSEIPELRSLYGEFRSRGFVVLGIGVKQGGDDAIKQRKTAMRQHMDYPLVHDAEDAYQKAYGLTSLPLNILVDSAGVIRFKGPVLPADIVERTAALLNESGPAETRRE